MITLTSLGIALILLASTSTTFITYVLSKIAWWKLFKKMGYKGWESLLPLYCDYLLFEELYGNGWKMLTLLIPFYNIYVLIKLNIDFVHSFNKGTGFIWGAILLPHVFYTILGLGDAQYLDGTKENIEPTLPFFKK